MEYVPSDDDVAAAMAAVEREQQLLPPQVVLHPASNLPHFGGAEGDYAREKVKVLAAQAKAAGEKVDESTKDEIRRNAERARAMNSGAREYLAVSTTKKKDGDEN